MYRTLNVSSIKSIRRILTENTNMKINNTAAINVLLLCFPVQIVVRD